MISRLSQIRVPVRLRRLLPNAVFVGPGNTCVDDVIVNDITSDSRKVGPGMVFSALPGHRTDGAFFVRDAIERGASALLVASPIADVSVPQCVVDNVRATHAVICSALANDPSASLSSVGITGTNGKTTTAWMLRSILKAAGHPTGLLGTIEYHDGRQSQPASLTTPDPETTAAWLNSMVWVGTTHAVMEASSHALEQERLAGVQFDAAVLTNITRDHLDYHSDFPAYAAAKLRIVERLKPGGIVVLNADDETLRNAVGKISPTAEVRTFGVVRNAEYRAEIIEASLTETRCLVHLARHSLEVRLPLIGEHNLQNALAAATTAEALGVSPHGILSGLERLQQVPGRLEHVFSGAPFEVLVDYAHTPDAIAHCLRTLRPLTRGRLIAVYGAGGDRDRDKRPLMGHAGSAADVVFLTSDNPRSEDPSTIIDEIASGFPSGSPAPRRVVDREEAIHAALAIAQPLDTVVVLGKGHETTQEIDGEHWPFDDRKICRAWFSETEPVLKCA